MKRIALASGLAACIALSAARAEDAVYRHDAKAGKDVPVSGTIQDETPAGVKIKPGKDVVTIPPGDIVRIDYDVKVVGPIEFAEPYGKEQDALSKTGEDRKKELVEALDLYRNLAKKLKGAPNAQRYLEYRIALLQVEQAKDDPTKTDDAIKALADYHTSNSGGWEIVPATRLLAQMLEDKGDQAGARLAYEELAANPDVPPGIQLATNLRVARMLLHEKKYADAEQKLKGVAAGMKLDDPQRAYVQVYLASTAVAQGRLKEAEGPLKDAVKGAGDDNLKALAYNTLGDYFQQNKQPEEAFWDYLRVDVLYGQDREEHARALYNLWKLFDSVRGDAPRAQDCLKELKKLTGTEYAARAEKEAAGEKKAP
jgi:predicted Zn-dependent protease